VAGLANLALSYAAGALSTLSPCVLPLLPIILFGAVEKHTLGPLMLAAGLATSFAGAGIVLASVGFSLGLDPSFLRLAVALLLLGMAIFLLVPVLQDWLGAFASPLATGGQRLLDRLQPSGIGGQFLLGMLLGVVWSPCAGPTLGAAIGLAGQGEAFGQAAAIMLTFGLGAATPIVALAYGSRHAIFARRDRLTRVSRYAKPVVGSAFAVIGIFVLTGLDKIVEASLTRAMPDWLVTVTTRL